MDLHSEGDNWLQTGAIVDSTELRHTENKFILNKFPTRCDRCFLIRSEKEPKASDVSAAYWLYQHTQKKDDIFSLVLLRLFSGPEIPV